MILIGMKAKREYSYHDDTARSELTISLVLQHLDKLLEFSIDKNNKHFPDFLRKQLTQLKT